MKVVILNGKDYESMRDVHDFLARELDFPHYYGRNLSALYDVLTDISDDTKIVIDLTGTADGSLLDDMVRMAEVMADASMENDYLEIEYLEN